MLKISIFGGKDHFENAQEAIVIPGVVVGNHFWEERISVNLNCHLPSKRTENCKKNLGKLKHMSGLEIFQYLLITKTR